ncbi:DUF4142 domain-containing protein [Actinomadura sp. KC345]|uniref:DUF4142 domain-containing protein n=1 Tax=Actinomadura sp. KC345 TaxID=2530371 RepID=UPI001046CEE3|nr:DUF4142 domain-containing protein [Actinomadura sp. KC345]TDC52837.1 DUF4142 domain-containing protein [Actinomadura sp. KC345]
MRGPRPATVAACGLAAALLAGGCEPMGRQSTDGGAVPPAPVISGGGGAPGSGGQAPAAGEGLLADADRLLLVQLRQAALWEIQVGRAAARRGSQEAVRKNLGQIATRHIRFDEVNRATAARLNVPLPDEPTAEQQSWMSEITGKSGTDYDKTAVARMRTAQGQLYARTAAVRASTRNTVMRRYAQRVQAFVNGQLKLLESTGFVTVDTLPDPPAVTGAPQPGRPGRPSPAPAATSVLRGGG